MGCIVVELKETSRREAKAVQLCDEWLVWKLSDMWPVWQNWYVTSLTADEVWPVWWLWHVTSLTTLICNQSDSCRGVTSLTALWHVTSLTNLICNQSDSCRGMTSLAALLHVTSLTAVEMWPVWQLSLMGHQTDNSDVTSLTAEKIVDRPNSCVTRPV